MADSLRTLISNATSPHSPGGKTIQLREARAILDAAKQNGTISVRETDTLVDVFHNAVFTRAARALLKTTLGEALERAPAGVGPNALKVSDLELNGDGEPTLNGRPTHNAWVECAETMAEFYRESETSILKDVPLATRKTLLANAIAKVTRPTGRNAADRRQVRSSAFTVAFGVVASLPAASSTSLLRHQAFNALFKVAKAEKNPRLAQHMLRLLMDTGFQKKLTRSQKAAVSKLFEAVHPQSFDVGSILDDEGYISWEHSAGNGENMFRSMVANLEKSEIGGASFKVVDKGTGWTNLEVTFKRGRGKGRRVKGIRIHVKEYRNDFFNSVGKPVGISYGGHSGVGIYQEKSLANAVKRGAYAEDPQFVFLDLCAGMDGLDDAMENLGNLHLLTTFDSSYYEAGKMKDSEGSFKGIKSSELQVALFEIWESLSREEDYVKMKNRVQKKIDSEDHVVHPNYIFNSPKDYKEVRWAHRDIDDDGVADALDIHYRFGLTNSRKSVSFKLNHRSDYRRLNGDTVRDAVVDLNVSTHYNGLTSENYQVAHSFLPGGFFDGKGTTDLVRFVDAVNTDGIAYTSVQVNSGLGHTSREALGALVHYAAMLELIDRGAVEGEFSEKERKLMGLVLAAARLRFDTHGESADERIWKKLLKAVHLPTSIPYTPLAKRLAKEKQDYFGNVAMMRGYKKYVSEKDEKALNSPQTGRVAGTRG